MLWSLVKIVLFVLIVAAATMFASYLLELDGSVRIAIGSVEYNLNTLTAVISLLVLILAVWVLIKRAYWAVAQLQFRQLSLSGTTASGSILLKLGG